MSAQTSFKLVLMRYFSGNGTSQKEKFDGEEEDDVLLKAALEEHSRREEEILDRGLKSTLLWHV